MKTTAPSFFGLCVAFASHISLALGEYPGRRGRPDTFREPRAGVRWRHWIQDAYIEPGVLQSDVEEMAKVGSEGFELLSYQSYGQRGPTLEDPTIYSYGADYFAETMREYAVQARENGMFMDWSMGPNQGAGVPYHPDEVDDIGFNTELVMGRSDFLAPGTIWNGTLPDPVLVPLEGYDGLVNFTAPIHEKELQGVIAVQVLRGDQENATIVDLDYDTLVDLSSSFNNSRPSSFEYEAPEGEDTLIIAFYSRRNGYPEAVPGFDGPQKGLPGSWGSFVNDHFSLEGARKAIESNEKWILPLTQDALNEDDTGFSMWTDSMEFRAQLYWTHTLASRFREDHGYSIARALPVLFGGKRPFGGANTPKQVFDYGSSYNSERFRNDYKQTLTNLYLEYQHEMTDYTRSIGMKYSDQPAYNFPLDVGAASTSADIPECESLGQPSIDMIRQFSGGVNLAGRPILSSEMGAGRYLAYQSTMIQQIYDARLAFAGGVNQILLHGYPSSTNYKQTTWPGLTPFVYEFSELHGPRQPAWRHYNDYMEMLGREMWMLRKGTPKMDLAVYRYGWDMEFNPLDRTVKHYVFNTSDLTEAGYSYEYVASYALDLEGVEVEDGRLMKSGPSYKALIVNRELNMTVKAANQILDIAEQGLPVVVLGDTPKDIPGYDVTGEHKLHVRKAMSALLGLQNVKQVMEESDVADALEALGVYPTTNINFRDNDYPPVVRRRSDDDAELYYVLNQGSRGNFSLGLETSFSGYPFLLDPRTGDVRPAEYWQEESGDDDVKRIDINFQLTTNQTALIAISKSKQYEGVSALPVSITSLPRHVTPWSEPEHNSISLRSEQAGKFEYELSNGTSGSADIPACHQKSLNLEQWNLTLQSWTPTQNLSSVETKVTNTTHQLEELVPWDEIPGHYNTSGIGFYSTNFTWSSSCEGNATGSPPMAELQQPFVQHTQRAWLNGQLLPLIDPVDPRLDLTPFLSNSGDNLLEIEVASPLLNAMNALDDNEVMSVGVTRAETIEGKIPRGHGKYGLMGAKIVPIQIFELHL